MRNPAGVAFTAALSVLGCDPVHVDAIRRGKPTDKPMSVCFDPTVAVTTSVANSGDAQGAWTQGSLTATFVMPSGRVFTNSLRPNWAEAPAIYQDGRLVARFEDVGAWGRTGGTAVAASPDHVFLAMRQDAEGKPGEDYPPDGASWHVVRRYRHDGTLAPWPAGRGWGKAYLIIGESHPVTGLAASATELYVAEAGQNRVRVFALADLVETRLFPLPGPRDLAIDRQGRLWAIVDGGPAGTRRVQSFDANGEALSLAVDDVVNPRGLAVAPNGQLLIGDAGPRQQVMIHDISGTAPRLVQARGAPGGVMAGAEPGRLEGARLAGISGVGMDAAGNLYVGSDWAGADLRALASDDRPLWNAYGYGDGQGADWDPTTGGMDLFTAWHRYRLTCRGGGEPAWTPVAYTVHPWRYPQDPRLDASLILAPAVRVLSGRRVLYLQDNDGSLFVHRFEGEVAAPALALVRAGHPLSGGARGTLWVDADGDGVRAAAEVGALDVLARGGTTVVGRDGALWLGAGDAITQVPFVGLTAGGAPVYDFDGAIARTLPAGVEGLQRFALSEDGAVLLAMIRTANPDGEQRVLLRVDGWPGTPRLSWSVPLAGGSDGDAAASVPHGLTIAGSRVVIAGREGHVRIHDMASGRLLGLIDPPTRSSLGNHAGVKALAMPAGDAFVSVMQNARGSVVVHHLAR